MKVLTGIIIGLIFLLAGLAACGGGLAPPAGQQPPEQLQLQDSAPQDPAPAGQSIEVPEGAAYGELQRVSQTTVVLPPPPPGGFDPKDTELPQLLMFPVAHGKLLHGVIPISITAIDDIGVNFVALLIDEKLVGTSEGATLQHTWESASEPDGEHLVQIVVRDDGNNIGLCSMIVELDNTSDWDPPVVTINLPQCYYDDTIYVPKPYHTFGNGGSNRWNVAGTIELEVSAEDSGGVSSLDLYRGPTFGGDLSQHLHLAHTNGDSIHLSIDTTDPGWGFYLIAVAVDAAGNIERYHDWVVPKNKVHVFGRFFNASGEYLPGVDVYQMPHGWDDSRSIDLSIAVQHVVSVADGVAAFSDVPIGRNWFIAQYGEEVHLIEHVSTPDHAWSSFPEELTTFGN